VAVFAKAPNLSIGSVLRVPCRSFMLTQRSVGVFPSSTWFMQLEPEYLPVLKKVIVRGVNGEFPTERG
jgi:hypothetical protein